MPFNGSGTFSIVNTFVPNTTILSAAVNQNFTDIATGLSDCLTRDNQAGMTAVFRAVSGSVSAPGISFNSDTTAGLFLQTTGIVGLVAKSLGLLVNSAIRQVSSATVQSGGSGYAVGDIIAPAGGTFITPVLLAVATLSGSAVATVTIAYPGQYTVVPSNPLAQNSTDGSGTGGTFNLTFATQYTTSVVTNEAGALPWQRLGASSFVSGILARANAYDFLIALATFSSGFSINRTTSPPTITTTTNPTLIPNYISGLTLSTAGGSSGTAISAGVANDSTNTVLMNLTSSITKTTSSWVVGSGNGGLDTGAISINTWYHFYLIERPDTGVVDVCFSLSASAPTTGGSIPAAYTLFRRIGSFRTDGSSTWTKATQTGNTFIWQTVFTDAGTAGTSRSNLTLTVPTGVVVNALGRAATSAGGTSTVIFTSLQESDQAPTATPPNADLSQQAAAASAVMNIARFTNTSAQIGMRASAAGIGVTVYTYGWIDLRGQA